MIDRKQVRSDAVETAWFVAIALGALMTLFLPVITVVAGSLIGAIFRFALGVYDRVREPNEAR